MQSACNQQVQLPIERHSIGNQSPSSRHSARHQAQHSARHQARHSGWHSAHLRVPIGCHAASASAHKLLLMLQDPDEGGNQIGCDQRAIRLLMLQDVEPLSMQPVRESMAIHDPISSACTQQALSMHSARNRHALSTQSPCTQHAISMHSACTLSMHSAHLRRIRRPTTQS